MRRVEAALFASFPDQLQFIEQRLNTLDFLLQDPLVRWSDLFACLCGLSKELDLLDFVVSDARFPRHAEMHSRSVHPADSTTL